jgi:tetratricopeptide (TPR) repeat protein
MKKKYFILKVILLQFFLIHCQALANTNFFENGKKLFDEKKFEKSKIYFEQDLVFNPKSEMSYLYLAKIFKNDENETEQEFNLNTVILLNPKNEEAVYMLTLLKIKQSNYKEAKELAEKFDLICKSLCLKKTEIKNKLENSIPDDEETQKQ